MVPSWPKMAARRPKMMPRRAKMAPKRHPRRHKMAPRCAQDGTRTVKEAMLSRSGFRKVAEREIIEKTQEK